MPSAVPHWIGKLPSERPLELSDEDIDFLSGLRAVLFHVNHVYTLGFALNLRRRFFGGGSHSRSSSKRMMSSRTFCKTGAIVILGPAGPTAWSG